MNRFISKQIEEQLVKIQEPADSRIDDLETDEPGTVDQRTSKTIS